MGHSGSNVPVERYANMASISLCYTPHVAYWYKADAQEQRMNVCL